MDGHKRSLIYVVYKIIDIGEVIDVQNKHSIYYEHVYSQTELLTCSSWSFQFSAISTAARLVSSPKPNSWLHICGGSFLLFYLPFIYLHRISLNLTLALPLLI